MIAFGQNVRDELQVRGGDGTLSGALSAERGTHQQTFVAIRNSGRDADMRPGRTGTTTQDDVMFSLQAEQQHAVAFTERTRAGGRNLETQDEIAYALTNPGNGGRTQERRVAGPWGVRRLTPTECERLQGFPDGHTAGQSDSARYRQLGNAVCEPVVRWIGKRIAAVEEGTL